jgi:CBS domain-containing protein
VRGRILACAPRQEGWCRLLIGTILRGKGTKVATVPPQATVAELLATLAEYNIGAVVVSEDGATIAGIVSERDVVRQLHERGAEVLGMPVSTIMTSDVRTCAPDANVDDLRRTMTDHRIRHVPVVRDGRLAGIVSIGDVVKSAIEELETEREALVGYLQR